MLDRKEPTTGEWDALVSRAGRLLVPVEHGDGFSGHYFEALQRDPTVVLAHGEVMRLLGPRTPPERDTRSSSSRERREAMAVRTAEAVWTSGLKDGKETMTLGSGAYEGTYSFASRFEQGAGTNPEELIAAAHAGCFSMALSAGMERAGHKPKSVRTTARVHLEKVGDGFQITRIQLQTEADVPGIDPAMFREQAEGAKKGCPVSRALAAVQIELDAKLRA